MRRFWLIGAFGVLGLSWLGSALLARQGVVVTQDGKRFEGDVVERPDAGAVDITPKDGQLITVNRANIASINYADDIDRDIRHKLGQLDAKDTRAHLDLAQSAADKGDYEAARDVLLDAQKADPHNRDVIDMLGRVTQQLRARTPATNETVATSRPAATQESTTRPAVVAEGGAKRILTLEEVNRVRELELGKNDSAVRVRIDQEARKKFLAFKGMAPAEFSRLSPVQQAYMILDEGKRDMRDGVHIMSDPPPLAEFRREVARTLATGCATSKCHGSHGGAGNFYLFPQIDNEAAVYTNFVILSKYSRVIGNRKFAMIDRETPGQSLLLEYLLPPEFADQPHSNKGGYHGVIRSRQEPRYKQISNWVSNQLPIPAPDYNFIDLSAPPTTKPAAAAAATP